MAKNDKQFRNVLVMRLSVLGNVAMTIPVLYPVCKANPDTRFIMLTKKWPASMFHDRPANLKVVDFDVKENYLDSLNLRRNSTSCMTLTLSPTCIMSRVRGLSTLT